MFAGKIQVKSELSGSCFSENERKDHIDLSKFNYISDQKVKPATKI